MLLGVNYRTAEQWRGLIYDRAVVGNGLIAVRIFRRFVANRNRSLLLDLRFRILLCLQEEIHVEVLMARVVRESLQTRVIDTDEHLLVAGFGQFARLLEDIVLSLVKLVDALASGFYVDRFTDAGLRGFQLLFRLLDFFRGLN